jgi:hypothetical protein
MSYFSGHKAFVWLWNSRINDVDNWKKLEQIPQIASGKKVLEEHSLFNDIPEGDVVIRLTFFPVFLICCFLGLRRLYKKFGPKIGFSLN